MKCSTIVVLVGAVFLQTTTVVQGQWWTAFHRQKSTCKVPGYFINPFDCTKFFRCVDHSTEAKRLLVRYDFDCPEGTAFDEEVDVCNYPGPSGCAADGGFGGSAASSGGNGVGGSGSSSTGVAGGSGGGGSGAGNNGGGDGGVGDGGVPFPAYPFFWPPPPRPANPRYYPPFYSYPGYDNRGNYVVIYTNSKKK